MHREGTRRQGHLGLFPTASGPATPLSRQLHSHPPTWAHLHLQGQGLSKGAGHWSQHSTEASRVSLGPHHSFQNLSRGHIGAAGPPALKRHQAAPGGATAEGHCVASVQPRGNTAPLFSNDQLQWPQYRCPTTVPLPAQICT